MSVRVAIVDARLTFTQDRRQLREAEVEDLHVSVAADEQVRGLEVAVDDPSRVGGGQTFADLHRILYGLARRHRPASQPIGKSLTRQQLEDDVWRAIVGADVENRQDVGMVEGSCCPGLVLETAELVRAYRRGRGKNLNRHVAPEARIAGTVDLAHAP